MTSSCQYQNMRCEHGVFGAFQALSAYEELAPLTFPFVWLHGSRDRSAPVLLGFHSSISAVLMLAPAEEARSLCVRFG